MANPLFVSFGHSFWMWITVVEFVIYTKLFLFTSMVAMSSATREETLECFPRVARITVRITLVSFASVPEFQGHTALEGCFILIFHSGVL